MGRTLLPRCPTYSPRVANDYLNVANKNNRGSLKLGNTCWEKTSQNILNNICGEWLHSIVTIVAFGKYC
jgi:hypothetical protein